jgi:hypothetical protein
VVITITYTDADVAGLNPTRLAIARYATERGAWLALPSSAETDPGLTSLFSRNYSGRQNSGVRIQNSEIANSEIAR